MTIAQYISCRTFWYTFWFCFKLLLYPKISQWWVSVRWNLPPKIIFKSVLTKSFSPKIFDLMLAKKLLSLVTKLKVIWSPLCICCNMNVLFLSDLEKLPSHCLILQFSKYCLKPQGERFEKLSSNSFW